MIINYQEFKNKAKRDNQVNFEKTLYFSSKFSKPISYLLFRIGLNANQAIVLFFFYLFLYVLNIKTYLLVFFVVYSFLFLLFLLKKFNLYYNEKYISKN